MSAYFVSSRMVPRGTLSPLAQELFGAYEPMAMYAPEITGTLYQDAAGTTPVTAMEQPVGLMLDLSGNGNHAFQATTTKRGVVSRRVNQLTETESCVGADWSSSVGVTVEANAAPSPVGPSTATIVTTTGSSYHAVAYKTLSWVGAVTRSVELKKGNWRYVGITDRRQDGGGLVIDFDTGTVLGNSRFINPSVVPLGDGWFRIGFSVSDYAAAFPNGIVIQFFTGQSTSPPTAIGLVGATVIIRAASFTLATDAHLPYQWVNTATDYDDDPSKFPTYIRLDGVDDAYQTNSIDFTGTDEMTVWAGLSRLASLGIIMELSANGGTNFGTFRLQNFLGSGTVGDSVSYGSSGSNLVLATNSPPINGAAPVVITGLSDISADSTRVRADGIFGTTNSSDQGTGNYGNYPLYIGARAGTSQYFNGRLYSLIVRGAATPLTQIEAVENIIKNNMRLP